MQIECRDPNQFHDTLESKLMYTIVSIEDGK